MKTLKFKLIHWKYFPQWPVNHYNQIIDLNTSPIRWQIFCNIFVNSNKCHEPNIASY